MKTTHARFIFLMIVSYAAIGFSIRSVILTYRTRSQTPRIITAMPSDDGWYNRMMEHYRKLNGELRQVGQHQDSINRELDALNRRADEALKTSRRDLQLWQKEYPNKRKLTRWDSLNYLTVAQLDSLDPSTAPK